MRKLNEVIVMVTDFMKPVGLYPSGLARPVLAQDQDLRKSLELATETSVVPWMGQFTCLKQSSGETAHCVWHTAGRTWQQSALGVGVRGKERYKL